MKTGILMIIPLTFTMTLAACSGEEERRGTPHHEGSLPEQQSTNGREIRPGIDGSQATGQSPGDTISRGDRGATSY
jgi:hypothetical protein